MASTIVLYDIPTKEPAICWSPNTWKVRMVLNWKKIPYKTEWVEYPDIKIVGEKLGITPNDEFPAYTLPTITLPLQPGQSKPTAITDSTDIVKYLDKGYPEPSIRLDSPSLLRLREVQTKLGPAFRAFVVTRIPVSLSERSSDYFHETREKSMGMPLAQFEKEAEDNGLWETFKEGAKMLGDMLRENKGGPFFDGETPCYADIMVASYLEWAKVASEDAFNLFIESAGQEMRDLWDATAPWRERNDH